jgi:hypothetical protein
MHTSLQQKLASPEIYHLLYLLLVLFQGGGIGSLPVDFAVKITEGTARYANVGNVHISVNHPGNLSSWFVLLSQSISNQH